MAASEILPSIWCVIPVYNNGGTIKQVALDCQKRIPQTLVVDDGSTDADVQTLLEGTGIPVLRHEINRGKGQAILTALDYVFQRDAAYMITIDGDGQHQPADLERFIPLLQQDEDTLWIGVRDFSKPNIPSKSKFGRDFANFWLRVETGVCVRDCQSGFRAYPVKHFKALALTGNHYDFETEALTRAAWAGLDLKMVDIDVWYPEPDKRVSSFRPFMDNFRISIMHSRLVLRHLLPIPHKKLVRRPEIKPDWSLFVHPVKFLKKLLKENASPMGLAASAAVGIVLGTLPLIATHTLAILYVTTRLHLNKILAVTIQNLCNPPFIPFLCIEIGYFVRTGEWLTSFSKENFISQVPLFLWDWFLGSLIVAPLFAAAIAALVYFVAKSVQTTDHQL